MTPGIQQVNLCAMCLHAAVLLGGAGEMWNRRGGEIYRHVRHGGEAREQCVICSVLGSLQLQLDTIARMGCYKFAPAVLHPVAVGACAGPACHLGGFASVCV